MILAGTGHRPNKLGGYDEYTFDRLRQLAIACLRKYKPTEVISGMALGWDMALASAAFDCVLPFTAAVPFKAQESKWPEASKKKYRILLDCATKVVIVNEGEYAPWKMQTRNCWMVDHCDSLLALWDGSSGGTANCIAYASKQKVEVINVWKSWEKYKIDLTSR